MDIKTIPRIGAVLAAAGIWLGASTIANAAITWGNWADEGGGLQLVGAVAGDVPGNGLNPATANSHAKTLLGLQAIPSTINFLTPNEEVWDVNATEWLWKRSGWDLSVSDLTLAATSISGSRPTGLGYDFALAKYAQDNAGYILFYLGGQSFTLPQTSASIWTNPNNPNESYDISSYALFNAVVVPETTTMVAGALLLLPFGVSTLRALRNRRARI